MSLPQFLPKRFFKRASNVVALASDGWQDQLVELLRLKDEASMLKLAGELLDTYDTFGGDERLTFFTFLLERFRADATALQAAIAAYQEDASPANVQRLNASSIPQRRALFEIFNMTPGGTLRLVRMRADLLKLLPNDKALKAVDSDLQVLFTAWFNRGFLSLTRIDWDTPAAVLERLMKYEAVHKISGWDDLHRRLSTGRRCYAFFHPALPQEPIIFVQVALVDELSSSIDDLLRSGSEPLPEHAANTAIFYSISNCQQGLRGIAFGDLLIKQVVEEISQDLPHIQTFATLSPIPGFGKWLAKSFSDGDLPRLSSEEQTALEALTGDNSLGWYEQPTTSDALKPLLERLCAHYLLEAKAGSQPRDPVSRFHLRNGARLERLNWLGDTSPKGLQESHGMLVNYLYDPSVVTRNHERYVYEDAVMCSSEVAALARR